MIFIAYADWMQTGDTNWLAANYPSLKTKLALVRERADGLVVSTPQQINHDDIVDWPRDERDGFVFAPVNTVVNAFHLRTLKLMAVMARTLHQDADAADFAAREQKGLATFQKKLFDPKRDLYRDGEDTEHSSLHANLFPLAFDLVPAGSEAHIAHWLAGRGMACSVYAAQYLLEGLFENGCASNAIALMTAPGDRSWRHMVDSGATITWEAWAARYKPNLDWNHALGAAPANLLPRFVLGVQPLTPGRHRASIQPQLGSLDYADGKVPTPLGPVLIRCDKDGSSYKIALTLPPGMSAQVQLPQWINPGKITVGDHSVVAHSEGFGWMLDQDVTVTIEAATQPEASSKPRRSILKTGAVTRQIERKQLKLAMSVGDSRHYRIDEIKGRHFIQSAERAGLPGSLASEVLTEVSEAAETAIDTLKAAATRFSQGHTSFRESRFDRPPEEHLTNKSWMSRLI